MKPYHLKASQNSATIYVRQDGASKAITLPIANLTEQGRAVWAAVLQWFDTHNLPADFHRNGPLSIDIAQGAKVDPAFVLHNFPVFLVSAPVANPESGFAREVQSSSDDMPEDLRNALMALWQNIEASYGFESYFWTEQRTPTNEEGTAVQAEDFDTTEEREANPSFWQRIQLWYANTFGPQ